MDQTLDDLKLNGSAIIVRVLEGSDGDVCVSYVFLKHDKTQKKNDQYFNLQK